jgi:hypothetical protein
MLFSIGVWVEVGVMDVVVVGLGVEAEAVVGVWDDVVDVFVVDNEVDVEI